MSMLNITLLMLVTSLAIYSIKVNQSNFPLPSPETKNSSTSASQSISPTNTPAQNAPGFELNNLQYPGSLQISTDNQNATFESEDNPEQISNWYKSKLKELGLKTTSAIQTNTNGRIFNNYISSDDKKDVRIEISKINNNPVTKIIIYIDQQS